MSGREKRDIRPVLLKFGVALALSLGGVIYSILRNKRIKPPPSLPPPPSESGNQVDAGGGKTLMKKDHEEPRVVKVSTDSPISALSPSSRYSGDKDGLLLPEFNELVKEFDLNTTKAIFSPKIDSETPQPDVETPRAFKHVEREFDNEQEIKSLKNMVRILRERERTLEIQLLEYCGLKEQETAVMELQNRLKINNMEAKLFNLKIESLQADKRRLEAQVADYAKVVVELEAAKSKIRLLKKKLKSEAEQNREQILVLQQRVKKLQNQEHEAIASDQEIQMKLQRLKDLEGEAEELRKSNHSLRCENCDLAGKLDYTQLLANSVLEDQQAEALKIENNCLRQQNEDLSKQIEQLQSDRCADVEELVYLRWINACLRYELRNYQPGPGKTVARDLSKNLSPMSEEKTKQLIVEYANKEGIPEKSINITDSDFDQWSSSHSYVTDSGDLDDSSVDNSSTNKTNSTSKMKFFSKLRRLIRGKDSHHHRRSSLLDRTASGEFMGTPSGIDVGTEGQVNRLKSSSLGSRRYSLDLDRLRSLKIEDVKDLGGGSVRNSDVGLSGVHKSMVLGRHSVIDSPLENTGSGRKSELVKYAEALKDTSGEKSKFLRRSATHASF